MNSNDIYTLDGTTVIRCTHCAGTGDCRKCVKRKADGLTWYECQVCGHGPKGGVDIGAYREPICKICGGKGYTKP